MSHLARSSARAAVHALQALSARVPQLELPTEHFFAKGMYARMVHQRAGALVVGKTHLREHFFILCAGSIRVTQGDDSAVELCAPAVLACRPGTKRAILALTEAAYLTVHRTDRKNLDRIEAEQIERDDSALFDARNKLKVLPWRG